MLPHFLSLTQLIFHSPDPPSKQSLLFTACPSSLFLGSSQPLVHSQGLCSWPPQSVTSKQGLGLAKSLSFQLPDCYHAYHRAREITEMKARIQRGMEGEGRMCLELQATHVIFLPDISILKARPGSYPH